MLVSCFEVQPPLSPELNPENFLSVGTINVLAYSVATEMKRHFTNAFRGLSDHSNCPKIYEIVRQSTIRCVHVFIDCGGGYFEHFL